MELTKEMINTLKRLVGDLSCPECQASSQCNSLNVPECILESWLDEQEKNLEGKG